MLRRDLYMGHQSSDSPAMPMAGACTRALRPGTPRPAGRSSPAGLAGSPEPHPGPLSPRRPAGRDTLPPPQARRRLRSPAEAAEPESPLASPGQRSRRARLSRPGAPGRRLGHGQPPGRGRGETARPTTRPPCPGTPLTHIRSGTSRRPSTIISGRKSSLKAEVMLAAREALGGRAGARGAAAVRASERPRPARRAGTGARGLPPRGGRPSRRHRSHSLPPAPPIPSGAGAANPRRSRSPGRGVRSARCGQRGRSSALNPCGPARGRDLPEAGGRPGLLSSPLALKIAPVFLGSRSI